MEKCKVVRAGDRYHGKQGLDYFSGISSESAGSTAICMHLLVMAPGTEAKPHFHDAHETAIYVLEGAAGFRHGQRLEFTEHVEAGDFIYIPAGVPHQPFTRINQHAKALIARTDPNEQESVVLLSADGSSRPSLVGKEDACEQEHQKDCNNDDGVLTKPGGHRPELERKKQSNEAADNCQPAKNRDEDRPTSRPNVVHAKNGQPGDKGQYP